MESIFLVPFFITTLAFGPIFSGISNKISFNNLLITVCSLRSISISVYDHALLDISSKASLLKGISTFSAFIKAVYCFVSEFLVHIIFLEIFLSKII